MGALIKNRGDLPMLTVLLCTSTALLACQSDNERSTDADAGRQLREWVFIFHLPNDNDLDYQAAPIRGSIRRGLVGDQVAATLLVDRSDRDGLRRVSLTREEVQEEVLETDDSTDVGVFEEYLSWASTTFPARHYALALLGHGGRLDEIALDLQPSKANDDGARWASSKSVASAIRRWKASLPEGELELLFLHQCGRATIEELYTFRETAEVIVASETFVGAPNTYYRPVLQSLEENPDVSGADVAKRILETERHAAALAAFDGAAIDELPRRADALVAAFRLPDGKRLTRPLNQLAAFGFSGDVTYDVCSFLEELAEANGLSDDPTITEQLRWFRQVLVLDRMARHIFFPRVDDRWCGIAMLVPWIPQMLDMYEDVPFYRQSHWRDLIDRLEPPRVVPGLPEITPLDPARTDDGDTAGTVVLQIAPQKM